MTRTFRLRHQAGLFNRCWNDFGKGMRMAKDLQAGVCVSCGRNPGRLYWTCPYCGERVWHPLWRRVVCVGVVGLLPLSAMTTAWLVRPDWLRAWRAVCASGPLAACALAAGVGLLFLPIPDRGRVAPSACDRNRWRCGMAFLGWLLALCASAEGVCLASSNDPLGAVAGLCAVVGCGVGLWRLWGIPLRSLIAAALIMSGVCGGILLYAGV